MADNNRNYGYRSGASQARPAPAPQIEGDPLAELARLIGQQNEALASFEQEAPTGAGYDSRHGGGWPPTVQDGYGREAHDGGTYGRDSYDSYAAPSQPAYSDPRFAADPRYVEPRFDDSSYAPSVAPSPYPDSRFQPPRGEAHGTARETAYDPRYADPNYNPGYGSQGYGSQGSNDGYIDPRSYSDLHYPGRDGGQGYAAPDYPQDAQGYDSQGYDAQGYAAQGYGTQGYDAQGYGAQGYPSQGYPQDGAAAYGAPSGFNDPYFGGASGEVRAPSPDEHGSPRRRGSIVTVLAVLALAVVGTASAFGYRAMFGTGGTPVPPPVIKADPRPSKVTPMAGDPSAKPIQDRVGGVERVVSREEIPVDPAQANPRVVFPNLAEQGQKPGGPAVAANASPAEPKKIRTVAIKPDQPAARNGASDNAPLALSPSVHQAPAPVPAPRQQQASRPPSNGSPFPAPISAPAATGPYAVQVTSQRSEADAHASYKALQSQFPSVLGSRQPVIKRADLGDKGTYYRAQIPFASQSEASEFCSSLKSAGGQCVVQRN